MRGLILGVCFTSLGCVVAVYVVLVLAEVQSFISLKFLGLFTNLR